MFRKTLAAVSSALLLAAAAGRERAAPRAQAAGPPAGKVSGIARLVGAAPALPANPVYKHANQCGIEIPDERLVLGPGSVLANVLVYVVDIAGGKPIDTNQQVLLDNRDCTFVPHVLGLSRGQTLSIRNSDPFLHDAHAWLGARTLFNVGLPKGKTVNKRIEDVGLIQINCNVRHTWMRAYVFVAENPYHAVTDRDGRYTIADLPAGTYALRFWHELLGSLDRSVTIAAAGKATVDVAFQAVEPTGGPDDWSSQQQ